MIGTVMVVLMFQINQIMALYKESQLNMSRVPGLAIAQYILLKTPGWLQLTLPVGVALGASLSLSRIARESELTAMRSAGIPIRRILFPIIAAGILGSVLNYYITERLMPTSERAATKLLGQIGQVALQPSFRSNVALNVQGWIVTIGTVARGEGDTMKLANIMLSQKDINGEQTVVLADEGTYSSGNWSFPDAIVRVFKGKDMSQIRTKAPMKISQPISVDEFFGGSQTQELNRNQLQKAIQEQRRAKLDTRMLEIDYHLRMSLPASCLIFAWVGALLAITFSSKGPFVGVMLTFVLVMVYYNAFIMTKDIIGRNGIMPPLAAAWLPNAIFLGLGLILLRRSE